MKPSLRSICHRGTVEAQSTYRPLRISPRTLRGFNNVMFHNNAMDNWITALPTLNIRYVCFHLYLFFTATLNQSVAL